jgi:hypothetical protein
MLIKSADDKSRRLALLQDLQQRQAFWRVAVLPGASGVVCLIRSAFKTNKADQGVGRHAAEYSI